MAWIEYNKEYYERKKKEERRKRISNVVYGAVAVIALLAFLSFYHASP